MVGAAGQPRARDLEHLGALVESRDREAAIEQSLGDEAGAGGDVEHVTAVGRQAVDEEPPPAGILAERQHGADAVVRRPEGGEQLDRVAASLGHGSLSWHGGACGRPRAHRVAGRRPRA